MAIKISAVVLAKNEEENLERCLKSLKWCDEAIVIDDDSKDKTAEIAKRLGVKVFKRTLNFDFALQRSFGLEKTNGEWILFVDSDEEVPDALQKEIRRIIDSATGENGFYLKRRDFAFGKRLKHGETANVRIIRLARKDKGVWERPVHETWEIIGRVGKLKNPLNHYSHTKILSSLAKINHYTDIEARFRYLKGEKAGALQMLIKPLGKFFKNFFLLGGFLDGMPGFLIATLMSIHSFLVRVKLWELNNHVAGKYN